MLNAHYKIIFLSIIFLLFIPLSTTAQTMPKLENILILDISPTYPKPGDRVTVSVKSFSIDLNNSTISWSINGTLEQRSVGTTLFKFTAGELGSSTNINVVANIGNTPLGEKQITIRPTDADIIWQGNTSAHPLYKGKRMPSVGSTINVEAIPYFFNEIKSKLKANELAYSWRIDGKALPKASGRGRSTITISQIKPVKSILVEVDILSSDQLLSRKERLSIPIQDSELLIYENNPLLGTLFNKTINGSYSLTEQETKFSAYPFFMSFVDRNASYINYSWKLNNNPIILGKDKNDITVSNTNKENGKAKISVSVQNYRDIFQKSSSDFIIEFGKNTSPGFGF